MGRTLLKLTKYAAVAVLVLVAGAAAYLFLLNPRVAKPRDIKVPMTPERVARGKYIYTLADCDGCHSERDFTRFGGPVIESGRGKGFVFPPAFGFPGRIASANITPDKETGIGTWTDGEKIRAIRDGIDRNGRALFPMMGYERYRHMSDDDVVSLVAYLNSLAPAKNNLPRTVLKFPYSVLVRMAPKPAGHVGPPERTNQVKYGEYLATIAGCAECHTGAKSEAFAGGAEFSFPGMKVVSANITPDPETGIGAWSEEFFLNRFYAYLPYAEKGTPKVTPQSFTIMPWLNLSQLKPADLKAIFAYLRTQAPVSNRVNPHPPAGVQTAQTASAD